MIDLLSAGFDELLQFVTNIEPVYIYLVLFVVAFFENIIPPIPGDTFTIIGGYLAASGKLGLTTTFIAITIGTISSVMLLYYLGYRRGREFFIQRDSRFFSAKDIGRVDNWFGRFGAGTLLASRFVVGGRSAIAVGAGLSKYPAVRMTVYSYISTAVFHGVLIALAYLMKAYIGELSEGFNVYAKIILVLVGILLILWFALIIRRFRDGRKKA
jgi:membrane protein DedA with SNARE-associated domain